LAIAPFHVANPEGKQNTYDNHRPQDENGFSGVLVMSRDRKPAAYSTYALFLKSPDFFH
jgi:hypothetical protein